MGQGYIAQYGNDPTNGQHYWVESYNYGWDYGPFVVYGYNETSYSGQENITVHLNANNYTFNFDYAYISNDPYPGATEYVDCYYKGNKLTRCYAQGGGGENFYYDGSGALDGLIAVSLGYDYKSKVYTILVIAKSPSTDIGYTKPEILSSINPNKYTESDSMIYTKKIF